MEEEVIIVPEVIEEVIIEESIEEPIVEEVVIPPIEMLGCSLYNGPIADMTDEERTAVLEKYPNFEGII